MIEQGRIAPRRYTGVERVLRDLTMPALRRRFATLPSIASDTALTLLAAVFAAANFLVGDRGPRSMSTWAVVLALLCASSLLLRSRWPVGTLLAVGVLGSLYLLVTGRPTFAILPTVVIALYSAVAYSGRPRLQVWAVALGIGVVLNAVNLVARDAHRPPPRGGPRPPPAQAIRPPPPQAGGISLPEDVRSVLLDSGWMLTALLLGEALRGRRAYAHEAELRAVQAERAQREAERAQQELAQRHVVEERLRIARELHDVLAHTVALINVQAGVAAHVIDRQPEQARAALTHIKEASRATLQELRALVGVLRDTDGPAPRAPAPGLDALDDLIRTVRDAGLAVEVEVTGRNGPLPATVEVAACRILQEALTNVIKHAGPASVRVTVHQDGSQLELDVTNSGGHAPVVRTEGPGHGIIGMRERAAAIGGSLQAGPLPDGGFQVCAVLPIPGGAA